MRRTTGTDVRRETRGRETRGRKPAARTWSAVGRGASRALPGLLVLTTLVALSPLLAGCAESDAPGRDDPADAAYVEYMAALSIAAEEGLSGESAEARIAELGAPILTRDDIDGHVQRLSRDPVRWSRLEEQVEARVEELRAAKRAATAAPPTTTP